MRVAVAVATWLPVVMLGVAALTRATDDDGSIVLVAMHALLPWVLLGAWPMLTAAVLARRGALAAIAAALAAAHVVWMMPLVQPPTAAAEAPRAGIRLRLLTVNLYALNPRVADAVDLIRRTDADVLFLQELTPPHHRALARSGALDRYRYGVADPRINSTGSAIYATRPLDAGEVWWAADQPMTRATLRLDAGASLRVYNVHTTSPLTRVGDWNRQLDAVADAVGGEKESVLLAGDFNATRDHRGFRRLLEMGWRDAHDAVARPAATTWPAGKRRTPTLIRLDHVLVPEGVRPRRVVELRNVGSDHRPVLADVVVAGGNSFGVAAPL